MVGWAAAAGNSQLAGVGRGSLSQLAGARPAERQCELEEHHRSKACPTTRSQPLTARGRGSTNQGAVDSQRVLVQVPGLAVNARPAGGAALGLLGRVHDKGLPEAAGSALLHVGLLTTVGGDEVARRDDCGRAGR